MTSSQSEKLTKETNPQDSTKDPPKDWAETPLYDEFLRVGVRAFTDVSDPKYFTEEELSIIYEFVKHRYTDKEYK